VLSGERDSGRSYRHCENVSVSAKSSPRNHVNHNIRSSCVPSRSQCVSAEHETGRSRGGYRRSAQFKPLDRNTRARILFLAEDLERRTKRPGRRNGIVSVIGLLILRALVAKFLNGQTGLLGPSYAALQKHTGLCPASIANALGRLELCGILKIARRLVRQRIQRCVPDSPRLLELARRKPARSCANLDLGHRQWRPPRRES
jgi:hypothetical protein